jgi:hypothetical protein
VVVGLVAVNLKPVVKDKEEGSRDKKEIVARGDLYQHLIK